MTYTEARKAAEACTNYDEVEELLHDIEDDETISDPQYYTLKYIAERAADAHQIED